MGSDVYVAGVEYNSAVSVAKYWKNGQAISLTDGTNLPMQIPLPLWAAMYMWQGMKATEYVAKYWKNGQAISLTDGTNDAYASSIAVVGSDVYVAGDEYNGSTICVAKYWKNGQAISLTDGTKHAYANSIVVVKR